MIQPRVLSYFLLFLTIFRLISSLKTIIFKLAHCVLLLLFLFLYLLKHLDIYIAELPFIHILQRFSMQLNLTNLGLGIGAFTAGVLEHITSAPVSPDNTCGITGTGGSTAGYKCPTELACCSANGFCGSTEEYCSSSNGCQSTFGSCDVASADEPGTINPETCGPGIGSCAEGQCCSLAGFCGATKGMNFFSNIEVEL